MAECSPLLNRWGRGWGVGLRIWVPGDECSLSCLMLLKSATV